MLASSFGAPWIFLSLSVTLRSRHVGVRQLCPDRSSPLGNHPFDFPAAAAGSPTVLEATTLCRCASAGGRSRVSSTAHNSSSTSWRNNVGGPVTKSRVLGTGCTTVLTGCSLLEPCSQDMTNKRFIGAISARVEAHQPAPRGGCDERRVRTFATTLRRHAPWCERSVLV
jgi:hypothetical protein